MSVVEKRWSSMMVGRKESRVVVEKERKGKNRLDHAREMGYLFRFLLYSLVLCRVLGMRMEEGRGKEMMDAGRKKVQSLVER